MRNAILLIKFFWPTLRKNCSSDQEFEAEGWEFAKSLRSLEQFIQAVKGQNNFWQHASRRSKRLRNSKGQQSPKGSQSSRYPKGPEDPKCPKCPQSPKGLQSPKVSRDRIVKEDGKVHGFWKF